MEIVKLARMAMATRFELVLSGRDPVRLRAIGEEVLREISRLDKQLSFYRAASDISRLNRAAHKRPIEVEGSLFELLHRAKELWRLTEGTFDPTVGPLMKVWGLTGLEGRLPEPQELAETRSRTGMHRIRLDTAARTVHFDGDGVQIDLGGIGKGFAVDEAVKLLREAGVVSALVHGGTSTVSTIGDDPDGLTWRIAVGGPKADEEAGRDSTSGHLRAAAGLARSGRGPTPDDQPILAVVPLRDQSLSVSDVGGKRFEIGGRTYGHVIDPRTGSPCSGRQLAVAVVQSAADADALSTALLIADDEERSRLRLGFRGAHVLTTDGSGAVDYSDFASLDRHPQLSDAATVQ